MCKLDLKDAYISVLLNPASRKLARFLWSGKLYESLCLCFGLRPAPRIFTKLIKIPALVLRHLNIPIKIYLDDMLLIDHTIEEPLMARDTVIFLLQQLGFVLNLKKSELTPTQRIEFLGVTIDSLTMTLSLPEKKVSKVQKQFQELLQKTKKSILELKKLAGLLPSTIQAVLPVQINFRYLQQQPIEALKTEGLCCKKVILNGNSKEELQWWIKNLKICNGRYVIQFHSQVLSQTDASSQKAMGCSISRDINRGAMKEEQLLQQLLTESSEISTFDLQQTKIFESSSFSNRQHHCTTLPCENGGGTGNQMLLKLSKEIWQYLLKHQITITAEYLPSYLTVEADWHSQNSSDPSE